MFDRGRDLARLVVEVGETVMRRRILRPQFDGMAMTDRRAVEIAACFEHRAQGRISDRILRIYCDDPAEERDRLVLAPLPVRDHRQPAQHSYVARISRQHFAASRFLFGEAAGVIPRCNIHPANTSPVTGGSSVPGTGGPNRNLRVRPPARRKASARGTEPRAPYRDGGRYCAFVAAAISSAAPSRRDTRRRSRLATGNSDRRRSR